MNTSVWQRLCSSFPQFLIYSTFVLVFNPYLGPLLYTISVISSKLRHQDTGRGPWAATPCLLYTDSTTTPVRTNREDGERCECGHRARRCVAVSIDCRHDSLQTLRTLTTKRSPCPLIRLCTPVTHTHNSHSKRCPNI